MLLFILVTILVNLVIVLIIAGCDSVVVSCRMVKALHIFLLVDGNVTVTLQQPTACDLAMLIPDVVSLLVLVKSTVKACSLTPDSHVGLVKDMLLVPVGPGQAKLNLIQVRLPCTLPGHVAGLCIYIPI